MNTGPCNLQAAPRSHVAPPHGCPPLGACRAARPLPQAALFLKTALLLKTPPVLDAWGERHLQLAVRPPPHAGLQPAAARRSGT
eukprot:CAMPEP_0179142706 /NCGR_PEP_ID=MMETSP0796-20121207/68565_1 /TAXON_ID=73915 /ORGANISM="Pyrodinium bahamense, Strain pbaha01" /LENGTH=83 /DNA_ID=CAMNT_0020842619 /DNA_START=211 /DNA_END=460 /DNA_ORIENTATION=-